jgi:hypothetical protein
MDHGHGIRVRRRRRGVGTTRGDSYAKDFYAYAIKKFRDQDKHPRSGWNVSGG